MGGLSSPTTLPAGFVELYDRHFEPVYRFVFAELGDIPAAEAAVREVFLAAAGELECHEGSDPWATNDWLLAIAQELVRRSPQRRVCERRCRAGRLSSRQPSRALRARARRRAR